MFVGLFSIVIGICFIVIGALMFKLHKIQAPSVVKQVTARLPEMGKSECVEFRNYIKVTNELDDMHHIALKPFYPKA